MCGSCMIYIALINVKRALCLRKYRAVKLRVWFSGLRPGSTVAPLTPQPQYQLSRKRKKLRRSVRPPRGRRLRFIILVYLCAFQPTHGFDRSHCGAPLGMESGAIKDEQVSASSSYVSTVGPHLGRLRSQRGGGGWCPKPQIEPDSKEYIEVDLNNVHVVTEIATQGRDNKGRGQEYMEEYYIEYFRPRIGGWKEYRRWDGKNIFTGNSDTTSIAKQRLEPAIYATKVRVLPYSAHRRTVCARIELMGCVDHSGVVSYTVPPSKGVIGDLSDSTYDGTVLEDGTLVDGLGRLTDGRVGADSFTLDVGHGKGTGWVAWNVSSFPRKCIDLLFEFSSVRNFTEINIYTNNYVSKKSQVFGQAVVFFHLEGMLYVTEPVVFHPRAELQSEKAKNVTIKIPQGGIGKHVKLRLYFVQTWIMISEVYFDSVPISGTISDETLKILLVDDEDSPIFDMQGNIILDGNDENGDGLNFWLKLFLGCLTAFVILVALVYLMVLYYKKYGRGRTTLWRALSRNKATGWIVQWTARADDNTEEETNNITQSMVKLELKAVGPVTELIHESEVPTHRPKQTVTRLNKRGYSTTLSRAQEYPDDHIMEMPSHSRNYNHTINPRNQYHNTHEKFEHHYNPQSLESTSRDQMPSTSMGHRRRTSSVTFDPLIEEGDSKYERSRKTSRYTQKPMEARMQFLLTGRSTLLPLSKIQLGPDYLWNIGPSDTAPPECPDGELVPIPAQALTMHSCHSCYLDREIRLFTTEKLKKVMKNAPSIVQVRYAHMYQNKDWVEYFQEVRMLASLSHPCLSNVIGIVTTHVPPLIVQEFTSGPELCRILRTTNRLHTFQRLIHITTQICAAMRYLESKSMVHRDLAARNCVMYTNKDIKVTDLAMYSTKYRTDYFVTPSGRKIPIRWMSWEAILLGQMSTAGAVWSFAVTAWEILHLCSNKPFASFSHEQIVEIYEHLFYGGELQNIIHEAFPLPKKCPAELYKMLQRCWRQAESERPSFDEIYKFFLLHYHEELPHEYML